MFRLLFGPGLFAFVVFALWIYCVFDVIASDNVLIRNLPKPLWLMIVIFVPTIGSVAWLALGRPVNAGWRPGDTSVRPPRRVLGPEDDPGFSTAGPSPAESERLRQWEADLERRERELRGKDGDDPGSGSGDDKPFPHTW